jgi:hypothetical protein
VREQAPKASLGATSVDGWDGFAFPFLWAKTGAEAMWNVTMHFTPSYKRVSDWIPVRASGEFYVVRFADQTILADDFDVKTFPNHKYTFSGYYQSPPSLLGTIYLVHDPVWGRGERQAWIYNAGQRRVRRAPDLAYDNIDDGSEGMRTSDQYYMFSGALDRYDWKLVGKKEIYVPYNNYKMFDKRLTYAKDIIRKGSVNGDNMRYELHRVFVVEGTLKQGMTHVYAKRTYYIDEDSYVPLYEDAYDSRGNLWRVGTGSMLQRYDRAAGAFPFLGFHIHHDLTNGQYLVTSVENEVKGETEFDIKGRWADAQPDALRRAGTR